MSRLFAIAVLVSAVASQASAATIPGLHVHDQRGRTLVGNGTKLYSNFLVGPAIAEEAFQLTYDPPPLQESKAKVGAIAVKSLNPSGLVVSIAKEDVQTKMPFRMVKKDGLAINVLYNCQKTGSFMVNLTIPVMLGAMKVPSINLIYTKKCVVKEKVEAMDAAGFDITLGTFQKGRQSTYAVRNGQATPAYDSEEHFATIRADTVQSVFYIQMSNGGSMKFSPPVVKSNATWCKVKTSGTALRRVNSQPLSATSEPLNLKLDYKCDGAGKADISVKIPIPGKEAIEFGFTKVCKISTEGMAGLDVTLGGNGKNYIVRNAVPMPFWHPDTYKAVVPAVKTQLTHYIRSSELRYLDSPIISSSNKKVCKVEGKGAIMEGVILKEEKQVELMILFRCYKTGEVEVTVELDVDEEFEDLKQPVIYMFTKKCEVDEVEGVSGFDITTGMLGGSKNSMHGTQMVVKNGVATKAYSASDWDLPTATVGTSRGAAVFFLKYAGDESKELKFGPPTTESNEAFLKVKVVGPAAKGGVLKAITDDKDDFYNPSGNFREVMKKRSALVVSFNCSVEGSAIVNVHVPLLDPARTIDFAFQKECSTEAPATVDYERLKAVKEKSKKKDSKIKELDGQLAERESELERDEEELMEKEDMLMEKEDEVMELEENARHMSQDLAEKESQLASSKDRSASLESRLEAATKEIMKEKELEERQKQEYDAKYKSLKHDSEAGFHMSWGGFALVFVMLLVVIGGGFAGAYNYMAHQPAMYGTLGDEDE